MYGKISILIMLHFFMMLQIEMIVQAGEYEKSQGVALQEFFDSTAGKWRTQIGEAWAAEANRDRNASK